MTQRKNWCHRSGCCSGRRESKELGKRDERTDELSGSKDVNKMNILPVVRIVLMLPLLLQVASSAITVKL